MYTSSRSLCFFIIFLFHSCYFPACQADVGTAAHYSPPYSPTTCFGSDPTQVPSSNLFAAAGDGIWENGASCGRQYLVGCISSITPAGACVKNQTIQIKIVDYAPDVISTPSSSGTTIVLSDEAFAVIAYALADSINIELQRVDGTIISNSSKVDNEFNARFNRELIEANESESPSSPGWT